MNEDTRDQLFEKLFPLPEGRPRRTLRFGNLPSPRDLPSSELQHAVAAPRPPFQILWEDTGLGLRFTVREQPSGDVTANIDADTQDHLGKIVSLALVGSDTTRQVRRKIRLVAGEEGGCSGKALFGTIDELAHAIGPSIQPTHILIEEESI